MRPSSRGIERPGRKLTAAKGPYFDRPSSGTKGVWSMPVFFSCTFFVKACRIVSVCSKTFFPSCPAASSESSHFRVRRRTHGDQHPFGRIALVPLHSGVDPSILAIGPPFGFTLQIGGKPVGCVIPLTTKPSQRIATVSAKSHLSFVYPRLSLVYPGLSFVYPHSQPHVGPALAFSACFL
jgi:hypothetical protein